MVLQVLGQEGKARDLPGAMAAEMKGTGASQRQQVDQGLMGQSVAYGDVLQGVDVMEGLAVTVGRLAGLQKP